MCEFAKENAMKKRDERYGFHDSWLDRLNSPQGEMSSQVEAANRSGTTPQAFWLAARIRGVIELHHYGRAPALLADEGYFNLSLASSRNEGRYWNPAIRLGSRQPRA